MMKTGKSNRYLAQLFLTIILLVSPSSFYATPLAQSPPNIAVNGYVSGDSVRRGRSAQAVVVMEIPSGFHVNSSRPLEKFLIPTQLQVEVPAGVKVSAVSYPRALLRKLKFSKNRVAVYEGRAMMRFNVTVPASYGSDSTELRARLKYQACNDEVCFPPQSREISIPVRVR
jgi:DsbC/DsbD-like thiol-disulfide interchange protein